MNQNINSPLWNKQGLSQVSDLDNIKISISKKSESEVDKLKEYHQPKSKNEIFETNINGSVFREYKNYSEIEQGGLLDSSFGAKHAASVVAAVSVPSSSQPIVSNINSASGSTLSSNVPPDSNFLKLLHRSSCNEAPNMSSINNATSTISTPIATLVEDNKIISDSDEYYWYYLDPRQIVQGPFHDTQMFQWWSQGIYFQNSLLMRRKCDADFSTLQDYSKRFNGVPFNRKDVRVPPLTESLSRMLVNPQHSPINSHVTVPSIDSSLVLKLLSQQQQIPISEDIAKLMQRFASMDPSNAHLMPGNQNGLRTDGGTLHHHPGNVVNFPHSPHQQQIISSAIATTLQNHMSAHSSPHQYHQPQHHHHHQMSSLDHLTPSSMSVTATAASSNWDITNSSLQHVTNPQTSVLTDSVWTSNKDSILGNAWSRSSVQASTSLECDDRLHQKQSLDECVVSSSRWESLDDPAIIRLGPTDSQSRVPSGNLMMLSGVQNVGGSTIDSGGMGGISNSGLGIVPVGTSASTMTTGGSAASKHGCGWADLVRKTPQSSMNVGSAVGHGHTDHSKLPMTSKGPGPIGTSRVITSNTGYSCQQQDQLESQLSNLTTNASSRQYHPIESEFVSSTDTTKEHPNRQRTESCDKEVECLIAWSKAYLENKQAFKQVDITTLIELLITVESPYEVEALLNENVADFEGSSEFVRLFLEKRRPLRQRLCSESINSNAKQQQNHQQQKKKSRSTSPVTNVVVSSINSNVSTSATVSGAVSGGHKNQQELLMGGDNGNGKWQVKCHKSQGSGNKKRRNNNNGSNTSVGGSNNSNNHTSSINRGGGHQRRNNYYHQQQHNNYQGFSSNNQTTTSSTSTE